MVWFDDDDLRELAGPRTYQRGLGYVSAVGDLAEVPGGVTATVHGGEAYRVRLSGPAGAGEGRLAGECTCPQGHNGSFCKHCVAVGLALLAGTGADPGPVGRRPAPVRTPRRGRSPRSVDLSGYLTGLGRDELVDLLLTAADDDPVLHRRLSLRATVGAAPDAAELRRLVGTLTVSGTLDHAGSVAFGRTAGDVLDLLDTFARTDPGPAGPLYRAAVDHLAGTAELVDDTAGTVAAATGRALAGYAAACRAAPPQPEDLAAWLLDTQRAEAYRVAVPLADFRAALGPDGLAVYRGLLARLLSAPMPAWPVECLRVARLLREAGMLDEAIGWLRHAVSAPAEPAAPAPHAGATEPTGRSEPDSRLAGLLAELCAETGRYDEALALRWDLFTRHPSVATHRALLDAAERAGTLAGTCDRALAYLRDLAAHGDAADDDDGHPGDPLVTVLLSLGDVAGAWSAAQEFGAGPQARLLAAGQRARTHPAEAVPVYRDAVDAAIDRRGRTGYQDAAELLLALQELYRRTGEDFDGWLEELKRRYRRRYALLDELAAAGL